MVQREERYEDHDSIPRELLRTRDRLHALESSVAAIVLTQTALETRIGRLEPQVSTLLTAREIAEAVDAKMRARGDVIQIRWVGKAVGALIALCSLAALILQIVHFG